jgi:site-specific DNA-methyltransferase (adenine-specific)
MKDIEVLLGDCLASLEILPDQSVHTCVTSPPYFGLRDYGVDGQIGLEDTPEAFVARLVEVFREVRRVLRDDGTLWLNLGDSYANKQRLMIPARVALAMQSDGWMLRDEIIWHKPRTTPAPVKDRTVAAHEMVYLFAKRPVYYFDYLAIEEAAAYPGQKKKAGKAFRDLAAADPLAARKRPSADREIVVRETRRKRSVWSVSPSPYAQAHFATFPPDLIEPCVLAGAPVGGVVLDPFGGSGTTAGVALKHGRRAILCELNPDYAALVPARVQAISGLSTITTDEGDIFS